MVDWEQGTFSPSEFLKAWNDYVAASQAICEWLTDPNAAAAASTPLPVFGAWQDFAKSLGMQFDPNSRSGFNPDELIAHLAPALGWARDYQGIVQRMLEIGGQFQRRYAEFLKQGADISEQALQATRRRIAADPQLASSPAGAYEAWIESAEAAYAQAAHGQVFSQSLGELCNLLSAFKVERGKLLDSLARHLDLPSRAEVDSLHRQIRDLNVAVRAAPARPSSGKPKPRKSRKPANK
jgi:Poly(R)-hydroxyalkanoic acid synthase subunit (PHA_synth_III_E)